MSMIIHKDHLPDIDLDMSSFIYDWEYILIQDEYICDVLKCMNVPEINENLFFLICGYHFKDYPEVLECYALKAPNNAYHYARKVIRGRFELGEKAIATDAEYSYLYAKHALKGRFELGEPIIATGADYSYRYATNVLRGRFELGEKAIATHAMYSYGYAVEAIQGRFELGEHVILDSEYAVEYREKFLLVSTTVKLLRFIKNIWNKLCQ